MSCFKLGGTGDTEPGFSVDPAPGNSEGEFWTSGWLFNHHSEWHEAAVDPRNEPTIGKLLHNGATVEVNAGEIPLSRFYGD